MRQGFGLPVRHGLGRAGRFGRPRRNPFRLFGLVAPNRALRRTENPRVGGSIPPLATTPNFLKRNGFPASPADYRRPLGAEMGRPSDCRKSGRSHEFTTPCGRRTGDLETWNPGNPRGAARVDAGPPLPGVPAWGALGRRPWRPPWPGGARPPRAQGCESTCLTCSCSVTASTLVNAG